MTLHTPSLSRTSSRGRRVVIAGAGPGGLATAMLAAAAGADVTVLERADRVGGRTSSITEDGYTFDVGPTFFLYPEVLNEIFEACGRSLEEEVELKRFDPMYRLQFEEDGGLFEATPDIERLKAEVAKISPEDAENVPGFIAENRAKFDVFRPILQRPFPGAHSFLSGDMMRALPLFRPWLTFDQDLKRWFKHPKVRLAFSFQSKYLGMSPFKCPSLFTIVTHVEYGHGVFHPIGGCNALTRAMARVAGELGVDVRCDEPIERLEFEGRRATAALTPKGRYEADALVLNADFASTMTKLVPDRLRKRWTDKKIAQKKYSCSTFMLYLGVEGRFDHLHHHTIFLSRDYLRNIDEIDAGLAPTDPTIYVQNASVTDPTLAPEGHSTLYVLVPTGNLTGGVDWDAIAPAYRAKVLRRLELMGIEGVEERIRYEKMVTPKDWERDMGIYNGATFNLAHNLGQMLHMRPRNRFEDLDGVYLTGGGTHPGSGLPTIFESAKIAGKLIAEDLKLDVSVPEAAINLEAAE